MFRIRPTAMILLLGLYHKTDMVNGHRGRPESRGMWSSPVSSWSNSLQRALLGFSMNQQESNIVGVTVLVHRSVICLMLGRYPGAQHSNRKTLLNICICTASLPKLEKRTAVSHRQVFTRCMSLDNGRTDLILTVYPDMGMTRFPESRKGPFDTTKDMTSRRIIKYR